MSCGAHGPHTTGAAVAASSGSAEAVPDITLPIDPNASVAAAATVPSPRRLNPALMWNALSFPGTQCRHMATNGNSHARSTADRGDSGQPRPAFGYVRS